MRLFWWSHLSRKTLTWSHIFPRDHCGDSAKHCPKGGVPHYLGILSSSEALFSSWLSGRDPIHLHRSVLPGRRGGGVGWGPGAAPLSAADPGGGDGRARRMSAPPPHRHPFFIDGRPPSGLLCGLGFHPLLSRVCCAVVSRASPALSLLASLSVNRGE